MCKSICFSKTCSYRFECESYRDENPSCNEDFVSGYCGKERELTKEKKLSKEIK